MEQLKTIGRELAMGSQGGFGQSKEFLDLIKSIGEARSKAEEERIIIHEMETLKRRLTDPDIPKRKMKEYIIRLVYVEMLGHDASFGYIHAVKMTHDDSLLLKRTGYLAVTLFLNEDHDLIILIVNTIQKDLKSDNYLVVCAALNAVCRLINEETIPAVLPQVVELLGHTKESVRKKAIMALHRFHQKSPSSVSHLISNFRKRLCDNDPGVMGATLCPLLDLITTDVNSYKDLVVSFVSILKQVAERRLPKSYDYHQMPAPFIQIKLLKILALLGAGDKQASEHMYTVVGDIFKKCDPLSNIGNAVLYQSICCVSSIYPNPKLLEAAADVISRFLKSDSHNLKYMGIDALGRLIKLSPDIAEQHQLAVIDCMEDPDDTLKRKTFELLYTMTKSTNVEVIVNRMIEYMININDHHYKTYIASRCVKLAEEFAPNNHWFIQTINKVFEHAGDLVNIKVAHDLMRLIAEGFGEDGDTVDSQLRSSAVESYLRIIGNPKLPSAFLQVICWVLGEYGTADGNYSASYIVGKLCDIAEAYSNDESVKAYAVTALMKVYAFEKMSGRRVDVLPEAFIKPQYVDHIPKAVQGNVGQVLEQKDERNVKEELCHDLQLNQVIERNVGDLSGGELQRFAIAVVAIQNAEIYMFDEPSSYLDVKQRLKAAQVIRSLLRPNSYVIVVEHDLSVLDYLSDFICCLYGKPGAYGVVTLPFSVREGINIFLAGFVPTENLRFRDESLTFKVAETPQESAEEIETYARYKYPTMAKTQGNFRLRVIEGEFTDSQIIVMLGENGTGKTTFIRMLAGLLKPDTVEDSDNEIPEFNVSYKPQKISPKFKSTVRHLLHQKIRDSYMHPQFVSDVMKPLLIEQLMDQEVMNLSGGELQRVALCLCLGKPADIYLIDEPSAYLDSEQRIVASKVIKRFILHAKKTAFVVEHDFIMATYLADRVIVYEGQSSIDCTANGPQSLLTGMNLFLSHLDITFRRDPTNFRPRINKIDSTKDREQKSAGSYYYLDD